MTEEELRKEAENFIIDRYKLNECYREDNAETREYMRMDVHSQYEEEYQLYLDATKELQKENTELRKEWQEQVQKATDEGYARTLQTIQLLKAKEIIKGLLELGSIGDGDYTYVAQAEQFLKDSEGK